MSIRVQEIGRNWFLFLVLTAGYENAPMQFVGGRLPEYLYIPSNFTFDAQMNILSDLPPDMVMELHLIKLGPDLEVPCIPLGEGEIGSWYIKMKDTRLLSSNSPPFEVSTMSARSLPTPKPGVSSFQRASLAPVPSFRVKSTWLTFLDGSQTLVKL